MYLAYCKYAHTEVKCLQTMYMKVISKRQAWMRVHSFGLSWCCTPLYIVKCKKLNPAHLLTPTHLIITL